MKEEIENYFVTDTHLQICILMNIQIKVFIFILGDGEILEEIVSASRQKEINKAATLGDGNSFQSSLNSVLKQ